MKIKFPKGILVITSKNCGSCETLKRHLRKLEVPFTEWDIKDHSEMASVARGIPYVMKNGSTFMIGCPSFETLKENKDLC